MNGHRTLKIRRVRTAAIVTISQNFLLLMDMISTEKTKEVFKMKIVLDDKLKDYMEEKGQKDIILYADMCNT